MVSMVADDGWCCYSKALLNAGLEACSVVMIVIKEYG